jgi:hypothetical protein
MWLVANMLGGVFAMDAVLTTSAPKGNQMFLTKAAPGKDCGRRLAVEQATRHAVKRCAGTA